MVPPGGGRRTSGLDWSRPRGCPEADGWQVQGGSLHREGLGSKAVPLEAVACSLTGDREKAESELSPSPSPHCCCVLPPSKGQFSRLDAPAGGPPLACDCCSGDGPC